MLEHPVIYKIGKRNLERELKRHGEEFRAPHFSIGYDRERLLPIRKSFYRDDGIRRAADALVDKADAIAAGRRGNAEASFRQLADDIARTSKTLNGRPSPADIWRIVLLTWLKRHGARRYYEDRESLGAAFLRTVVDRNASRRYISGVEDEYFQPVYSREALIRVAVALQEDQDFDALFYDYAPVVLQLAATATPFGRFRELGFAFELLLNAVDMLFTLHQMSSDGKFTEAETEEAWWNLAGLFPIRLLQLAVFARTGYEIGRQVLPLLLTAISDLIQHLEDLWVARQSGWRHSLRYDPATSVFIPASMIPDES
ncbi:MAG: hypothetical protein Tsb0019_15710 [Roseibium sp.]